MKQAKNTFTQVGRVQRLFGIYVPLKKVPSPKRYMTLRFCIKGIIPSKKNDFYSENNVRFVIAKARKLHGYSEATLKYIKENTRSWLRGSERYVKWCEQVIPEITKQGEFWREKYGLIYPLDSVSIKCTYYFADNTSLDIQNKSESVYDMLVKAGILLDDNYGVMYKQTNEGYNCKGEIVENVCVVDVTYMIFE